MFVHRESLRTRVHDHFCRADEPQRSEPLRPMRYVRHFTVAVSLNRSHLFRCRGSTSLYSFLHVSRSSARTANAKQWLIGKKRFNDNCKEVRSAEARTVDQRCVFFKGILWLVDNHLLEHTPEQVAAFLFHETGLNKRAIGDYLGEKSVLSSLSPLHSDLFTFSETSFIWKC